MGTMTANDLANDRSVASDVWGHLPDGRAVQRFSLTSPSGVSVQLTEYGARIVRVLAPDRSGVAGDVTLGHDDLAAYLEPGRSPYFGAVVGRFANRIARGRFSIDGQAYQLPINNPPNSLHGGPGGFDAVLWSGTPFEEAGGRGVSFSYLSPDGEEGYPGALSATVRYTLTDEGTLKFSATATATQATPVNVSNHTYWNLASGGAGSVLEHHLTLEAGHFLPVDETLIPLGEPASVAGTPFDFRQPHTVGRDLHHDHEQLRRAGGYDHHFVLDDTQAPTGPAEAGTGLRRAATLSDPVSGRQLDVWTTEPGLQVYSGNFLDGQWTGRGGARYEQHAAICLETQHAPDSPNQPAFPGVILRPGERFDSQTEWRFSVNS